MTSRRTKKSSVDTEPLLSSTTTQSTTPVKNVMELYTGKVGNTPSNASIGHEKKFHNLDQVLAAYGHYNKFYLLVISQLCACWFFAAMMLNLLFNIIPTVYSSSAHGSNAFCLEKTDSDNFTELQSDLNEVLPFYDDFIMEVRGWGRIVGFSTLFIIQYVGRRRVSCFAMLAASISTVILSRASPDKSQTRLIYIIYAAANELLLLSTYINTMEWLPPQTRPFGTMICIFGMLTGMQVTASVVGYSNDLALYFHILPFIFLLAACVGYFIVRDSPYYQLSQFDADKLQECFQLIEQYTDSEKVPAPADKLVDDVAFEVYEKYDTFIDFLWHTITTWKLVQGLLLVIAVCTTNSAIGKPIYTRSFDLDLSFWTQSWLLNGINVVGVIFAYLILTRSRILGLIIPFFIMSAGYLSTLMLPMSVYDVCKGAYMREGWMAPAYTVITMIVAIARNSIETSIILFSTEFFPTSARGLCTGLPYIFMEILKPLNNRVVKAMDKVVPYAIELVPGVLALLLCFLFLFAPSKPAKMNTHLADYKDEVVEKEKDRPSMPFPVVRSAKSTTSSTM